MLEAATLLFFPALMVFAAISDLLTLTISNRIWVALVVLFIAMAIDWAIILVVAVSDAILLRKPPFAWKPPPN